MRLATVNLYQFATPGTYWYENHASNTYTADEWAAKKRWIAGQLDRLDADLIGFQEVFSVNELRDLCGANGYPHFATVDEPGIDPANGQVFNQPIVAIASRLPLRDIGSAIPYPHPLSASAPHDEFQFSRRPLRAVVDSAVGPLIVYVAHLKSKRPMLDKIVYPESLPWPERVKDTLQALSRGGVAALNQRATEAMLLYRSVTEDIAANPSHAAVVVLGDLNDSENSLPIAALTMRDQVFDIGGVRQADWPPGTADILYDYRLGDSFKLAPGLQDQPRPVTHVYRGRGGVLDYILVSNALNQNNPDAIAKVIDFQVLNQHLSDDGTSDRCRSDHGQVVITLAPLEIHDK